MPEVKRFKVNGKTYYKQHWGNGIFGVYRSPHDFPLVVLQHHIDCTWSFGGEMDTIQSSLLERYGMLKSYETLPQIIEAAERGLELLRMEGQK